MIKSSAPMSTAASVPAHIPGREGAFHSGGNQQRNIFQNPHVRRTLAFLRIPLFALTASIVALFVNKNWLLAGFIVSLFGQLIQSWSFASLDKNSTLAVQGPYTMVRNPMYLGRYFLILGFTLTTGSWGFPAVFIV
ncbi:MAG: hypothetical protein LBV12_03325, partial [Puniceicoccales bacterium]|nr:hypothetical protein [Puniceicoccales bacterium]